MTQYTIDQIIGQLKNTQDLNHLCKDVSRNRNIKTQCRM